MNTNRLCRRSSLLLGLVILCFGAAGWAAEPRSVTVDLAQKGAPISPLIYGQFIEHLGRCIYGGIWAEMLEDRKFFYPVGEKLSPWKAIGPAEGVQMTPDKTLANGRSPEITLNAAEAGLAQAGLAVVKGKSYTGRIWLSATSRPGRWKSASPGDRARPAAGRAGRKDRRGAGKASARVHRRGR